MLASCIALTLRYTYVLSRNFIILGLLLVLVAFQ